MSPKSPNTIYQLKITLRDSKPPIWRRVLVPGKFSLHKLHLVIQAAMGWENYHLYQFNINDVRYSAVLEEMADWEIEDEDAAKMKLAKVAPTEGKKFSYEYDFGDGWMHDILVEKILPPEEGEQYPRCIKGKLACPLEDSGGIWGYYDIVESVKNPDHPDHNLRMDWAEGEFDPEKFDIDDVNRKLAKI